MEKELHPLTQSRWASTTSRTRLIANVWTPHTKMVSDSWNLNYLRGALVWIYKIRELHQNPKIPITVAIDAHTLTDFGGDAMVNVFKFLGADHVMIINESFRNEHSTKRSWQNTYTKLVLFDPQSVSQYTQIAYFDADNFPLEPMYELFAIPCGYLLGAVDDVSGKGINAGFLVIRPDQIVYDALHSMYSNAVVDGQSTRMNEQDMIRTLFCDIGTKKSSKLGLSLWNRVKDLFHLFDYERIHKMPSDPFYFRFPYEYNSPWWQFNEDRPGGWRSMKNIHNRGIWRKGTGGYQLQWMETWETVWNLLEVNGMTGTIMDLNRCSKKEQDVCTVDDML